MAAREEHETAPKSLQSRAVSGAVWVTAEMAGVQGTSFIVFATIAHFVQPRDFGLMSICYFAVQSLEMVILYNISTVIFRKKQIVPLDFTTAFWITIGTAAVLCMGLALLAGQVQALFHAPGLAPVLRAMSVILLFMGLSRTHETWLMRHFQFRSLGIRGVTGAVIGGATGVCLAIHGWGVDALVTQQIVTSTISTTLLWIVCPWRPGFAFSLPVAREIFAFMCRMASNNLVYAINQNCDTFLIAFVFGPASAGVYNIAKRVKLALQLVIGTPLNAIGLPALAEIQDHPERLQAGILKSLTLICMICCPVFFGAAAVAHQAVILVFGRAWAASAPVFQWLSLSGLATVLLAFDDNVFVLKNRPVWCLWVSLSYAVTATITFVVFAKLHGTLLALPFVLPYALVWPLSAALMARRVNLKFSAVLGAVSPGFSAALLMLEVVVTAGHVLGRYSNVAQLAMLCALGAVVYAAAAFLFWRPAVMLVVGVVGQFGRRREGVAFLKKSSAKNF